MPHYFELFAAAHDVRGDWHDRQAGPPRVVHRGVRVSLGMDSDEWETSQYRIA